VLHSNLPALFIVEARRAAQESRFIPARQDGKAVEGDIALPFRFIALKAPPSEAPQGGNPENPETLSDSVPPLDEMNSAGAPPADAEPRSESAPPPLPGAELRRESEPAPPAFPGEEPGRSERGSPDEAASSLVLAEAGFGRDAHASGLVGAGDAFDEGEKVFFWTRIKGGRAGQQVLHVWTQGGQTAQIIELTLKSADWPTWSYKTLFTGTRGPWSVGVWDENGTLLGERHFTCRAAP
jgi:hypothetical protein